MRYGEKAVRALEGILGRASLVGDRFFWEPESFPWTSYLEDNWMVIQSELMAVLAGVQQLPNFQDISEDQRSLTQDDRWKTYFLYGYGYKIAENCQRCPQTTRLIETIPGMKTAFFSIFMPHKHIPEHRGPYKGLLRYHLALKVPQAWEQCAIRVGTETRHWQEGKSLVFDDTFPHEAWNHTDEIRVVLFVDFVRPMRFPVSLFNRLLIQLIAWSPFVQNGRKNILKS